MTHKIETRYFNQDALGRGTVVTDECGRVETRHAYDPWGKQTTDTLRTDATGRK
jgi:hypothetical protein